jgi:hypothetical protein
VVGGCGNLSQSGLFPFSKIEGVAGQTIHAYVRIRSLLLTVHVVTARNALAERVHACYFVNYTVVN